MCRIGHLYSHNFSSFKSGRDVRECSVQGFTLPQRDIDHFQYRLRINGNDLNESRAASYDEVRSEYRKEFVFQPSIGKEYFHVKVEATTEYAANFNGPTKATVDEYYEASKSLKNSNTEISNVQFSSKDDLGARKDKLDLIRKNIQELEKKAFVQQLQLNATDPEGFLKTLEMLKVNVAREELKCLDDALKNLNEIEKYLKTIQFSDPEKLDNIKSKVTQFQTQLETITKIQFTPDNTLIGDKLSDFRQKSDNIKVNLNLKTDSLEQARSVIHQLFYAKGMQDVTIAGRRKYFNEAISRAPKPYAEPHYQLALMEYNASNFDRCLNQLDQAVFAGPTQTTFDNCIQLYTLVFKSLVELGDRASGDASMQYYLKAKRMCERQGIPLDCALARSKIRSVLDGYFVSAGKNINRQQFAEAWQNLLKIKDLEQQYQIDNNYQQQWDALAKMTYEGALLEAETATKKNEYEKAVTLLSLCQRMSNNLLYALLFNSNEYEFKNLALQANRGLFNWRLEETANKINQDAYAQAEAILLAAESQQSDNTAYLWFDNTTLGELKSMQARLASARFFSQLKTTESHVLNNRLSEAEKSLKEAEQLLKKDQEWLSTNSHFDAFNACQANYISAATISRLMQCRNLYEQGKLESAGEMLVQANDFASQYPRVAPLFRDSIQQLSVQIAGTFLAQSKGKYQQRDYQESIQSAKSGLRLKNLLPPEVLRQLQQITLDGYFAEVLLLLDSVGENTAEPVQLFRLQDFYNELSKIISSEKITLETESQKSVYERLRKKIFAEECNRYWNFYATNMKRAQEALNAQNYILLCTYIQMALDTLKDKSKCMLDQSEAETTLIQYKPAAEYQRKKEFIERSNQNREYQVVLTEYPALEEIYYTGRLAQLNVKHIPLEKFIGQQQEWDLLKYTISTFFLAPDKRSLVEGLLRQAQTNYPNIIKNLGEAVGQHLKDNQVETPLDKILGRYTLEFKQADRALKKAFGKASNPDGRVTSMHNILNKIQ